NDWTYTFTDLEAFDENGQAYSYSVEEKAVEGYETTIDGFDITNLRVGETEVLGTKTWLDGDGEGRPDSIIVELFANGNSIDTTKVTSKSDWKYEFTELPKYDKEGEKIKYTIEEVAVDGYESKVDGYDITNTWVDEEEPEPTDPKDPSEPTKPSDPSEKTDTQDKPDEVDKQGPTCEETIITIKKDGKPVDEDKTYKLTAKDGETAITATTDASGKLVIDRSELPSGTYVITNADGNKLGEITITDDTCELEFDYTTSTATTDEDKEGLLPNTATNTFNIVLAGALLLAVGAGFIIFHRRKKA